MNEILAQYGVLCLERAGQNTQHMIASSSILSKYRHNIHIVPQTISNDISSTKVRAAIRAGDSIKYLTPDPVIAYIKEHQLWG